MKYFYEKRIDDKQIFPSPADGEIIYENPPYFSWLAKGGADYIVKMARDGAVIWQNTTGKNFTVPAEAFAPGKYEWNVYAGYEERGWQSFRISENAVEFIRPTPEAVFAAVPDVRPRHLFFSGDIKNIKKVRAREIETLRRNITLALSDDLPDPPLFHKDCGSMPYREYFGLYRDYCDRDLVACALGYSLLGDLEAGRHAKALFFAICDMSPYGPCSLLGPWGDEIGLSNARCLPSVFDLIYPLMDEKERIFAARTVLAYARQCEERLIETDFCKNPGESHSGRIPAYLGEAAMVLKGTGICSDDILIKMLGEALEIYGGVFPHYGTSDGAWAEGTFYSTSYTKWFLPFFCAVERYTGVSYLSRPFYQRVTQFFLHFASPYCENHPFGDGYWCRSEDPEWPGFFAQNPCRLYAERFGPALAKKRADEAASPGIFMLHLLDIFIPGGNTPEKLLTGDVSDTAAFTEAGFVSLHTDINDPENDLVVIARASKFGSGSHRHPDQGSFAVFYKGISLISPSGYFGRQYGTKHHMEWLNSTRAHNTLLINGQGQKRGDVNCAGKIISCVCEGNIRTAELDLNSVYPGISWTRRFELTPPGCLVITDILSGSEPFEITYPLHSLSEPVITETGIKILRKGTEINITPDSGVFGLPEITDRFAVDLNEGEPAEYAVEMPQQYHISWKTSKKISHTITVCFEIGCSE